MVATIISEKTIDNPMVSNSQALIVETMMAWAKGFSASSVDNIIALYSQDASLWGTFSSEIRASPESIRDYFDKIFSFTHRNVTFKDFNIRLYGDTAISAGLYTFSLKNAGQKLVVPARYSFIYVKQNGRWLIAEHHSSVMPDDL